MRSQHVPTTPSAGNRQARRKARKLAGRSGATRQSATPAGADKIAAAVEHVRANRLDEAERLLRDVLQANADLPLAQNLLGQLLDKRACHRDAYHHHKQAVAVEPGNAKYWCDFGRCLLMLNQGDAAVMAYERAVAVRPKDPDCEVTLAMAYSAAG